MSKTKPSRKRLQQSSSPQLPDPDPGRGAEPGHEAASPVGSSTAPLAVLAPRHLIETMRLFGEALEAHRETINRLNVYPVPDGDTGTNMALTVEAVVAELDALPRRDSPPGGDRRSATSSTKGRDDSGVDRSPGMAEVCQAISHGSLMGARGNSGVILCQLLRGMTSVFAGSEEIDARCLASAFEVASGAARSAVMTPVEGTILSVAAAAAAAGTAAVAAADRRAGGGESAASGATESGATESGDLAAVAGVRGVTSGRRGSPHDVAQESALSMVGLLEAVRGAAIDAVGETPHQLEVLATAGVVDAGGAGLLLLYDSLLSVVDGRGLPSRLALPASVRDLLDSDSERIAASPGEETELANPAPTGSGLEGPRYEVMYFLEAPGEAVPGFREAWAGLGDSIVVVGGEGLWNCHIHTDDIGGAIEAALDVGVPRKIRVTDLSDQVEEERWVRAARSEEARQPERRRREDPGRRTGIVAVASGEGIRRIFWSLGVEDVVAGGQSMNPSTGQILELVEAIPTDEVVLLPNNANIFPVALQVAELSRKVVEVVRTPGIQEGFAALLEYDPEASAAVNARAMSEAARRVVAGEVTQAVRPATLEVGVVAVGDWLGLDRSGVRSIAATAEDAACGLLELLIEADHEIVTIFEGSGAHAAASRRITEWISLHYPALSVEEHHGGQPLYPYLISIE